MVIPDSRLPLNKDHIIECMQLSKSVKDKCIKFLGTNIYLLLYLPEDIDSIEDSFLLNNFITQLCNLLKYILDNQKLDKDLYNKYQCLLDELYKN